MKILWKCRWPLIALLRIFACMYFYVFFKCSTLEKVFIHWFQRYGFSPVCVFKWGIVNASFNEKHSENSANIDGKDMAFHLNVFLNVFSNYHHVKKLLGIEYKNTFLTFMCSHMIFQISILCKDLWEMITWVCLFTCILVCDFKFPLSKKAFWQCLQG